MRLADAIGRWFGRVEVVLAGADDDLRDGEEALAQGDAMAARAAAHRVLSRAPDSPLGLALLADACDAARLDAELAITLEELAKRAASRAEVWVRLGRARRATHAPVDDVRDAFVRALAVAESGSEARRDALLELADLDLLQGDGARAELWLDRAAPAVRSAHASSHADENPEVAVRRAEARLLENDPRAARAWLDGVVLAPADGRGALALGRALAMLGDAAAFAPLVRAMVLDAPGASELLSSTLAWVPADEATRARVQTVVDAKGERDLARWRAAFARSAGKRDEARAALADAVASGDRTAAGPLLDAALDDRDPVALAAALGALDSAHANEPLAIDARRLPSPQTLADPSAAAASLAELAAITHPRVVPWAEAMLREVARAWAPPNNRAVWTALLERLDMHARALSDLDAIARVAAVAAERSRPVRVAIVGEFNAGKSTFINALIGQDVAPTGVLPTTATLHHLRYAPDPIARIQFVAGEDPAERIVPIGDLRITLKALDTARIRRVEILLPIASLTRVEILDTPGFNAPDARHTEVARAAFEEADAAIWLLDAAQPLKQSERAILDEARAARLPVQMLVNKADRLDEAQIARVMAMVNESLAEAGLSSWSAPLALSARKALAGKMGDAAALEQSRWPDVQAMLDSQIVARSEELKERALRRRARQVVVQLLGRAAQLADDERARRRDAEERAHKNAQTAARIDADADDAADKLAQSLAPYAEEWRRDLAVVVTGRDPDAALRDRALSRYRVDRALERIAQPLARALSALAEGANVQPSELLPLTTALVRSVAATIHRAPEPRGQADRADAIDAAIEPLAQAAVATLVDYLSALSSSKPEPARAAALARELGAFASALGEERAIG
jgi:small GTP-binding protein